MLAGDSLAEHPVRPGLINQYYRDQDESGDRHQFEGIGAGGCVMDRQTPGRIERRHDETGKQTEEKTGSRKQDGQATEQEGQPERFSLISP